jgi:hypothetical protein
MGYGKRKLSTTFGKDLYVGEVHEKVGVALIGAHPLWTMFDTQLVVDGVHYSLPGAEIPGGRTGTPNPALRQSANPTQHFPTLNQFQEKQSREFALPVEEYQKVSVRTCHGKAAASYGYTVSAASPVLLAKLAFTPP